MSLKISSMFLLSLNMKALLKFLANKLTAYWVAFSDE